VLEPMREVMARSRVTGATPRDCLRQAVAAQRDLTQAALVGDEEMAVKVEKQVQPQAQASSVAPVAGELDFCFDFCFCGWLWSGHCAGKKKIGDNLKITTWVTPIVMLYANVKLDS